MLNPHENFLIRAVSRMGVADAMNDVIALEQLPIPVFTPHDDRLTGARCQLVAEAFAKILDDDLSEEERNADERDAIHAILLKHFR
jgi:hypothetical protein